MIATIAGVGEDRRPVLWSAPRAQVPVRHRLLLALETRHHLAVAELQPHDLAEWLRLCAAGQRDLLGRDYDEIADHIRSATLNDRVARRAVARGRQLLHALGAWPWRYFPGGRPPRGWRTAGGGPLLDAAFATWASGRPHVLGPGGQIIRGDG